MEGEEPEFSLLSWFAMLFSAGMGIGLVFWTTAEPVSHAIKQRLYIKLVHKQQLMMRSSLLSSIGEFMRGQCIALLH